MAAGSEQENYLSTSSHRLTTWGEVHEALRSPALRVYSDPSAEPFDAGTVIRIDGAAHRTRRNAMNALLKRQPLAKFKSDVMHPALSRHVEELVAESRDADGSKILDLVSFGKRTFYSVVAQFIGLDGVETGAESVEFQKVFKPLADRNLLRYATSGVDEILADAAAADKVFVERYLEPSMARHRAIQARLEKGEIAAEDVPTTVLMRVVADADPAWRDPEILLREVINLVVAGSDTSVMVLVHTVAELTRWLREHPEDEALLDDLGFLTASIAEAARLHAVAPALTRRAAEDVVLSSGRQIKEGEYVAIDIGAANRARELFGEDADTFDPRRGERLDVLGYGVAFGHGPHVCFGMNIAYGLPDGPTGVGTHAYLLRELYRAGMRADDSAVVADASTVRSTYSHFPIVLHPEPALA